METEIDGILIPQIDHDSEVAKHSLREWFLDRQRKREKRDGESKKMIARL